nr:hypothetical protein [Tanacetum cinerariifolium]
EVEVPSSNTQSVSNNMVPNVDEASTSHNVFNERLEDAYFDASTSFHDPFNVYTFYQPYPHEKKWTKDHPLHKIIGDPKSSVRTKALRDADWVSAMQEELDQFARLKTTFLNGIIKEEVYVGQPSGFVSTQYPDHVYALDKALYDLKQAPWAWYDVLLQFLIESGFQKVPTPMVEQAKLKLDLVRNPVDHTDYQSMIRSLIREKDLLLSQRDYNLGLWYPKDSGFDLTAYSDTDHAGCHLDQKTESEYVAVSSCWAQVLWMRTQLMDYGFFYDKVPIYCDSKSAIAILCNPVQQIHTKHIDVSYHFIKDHVEKGKIELYFIGTEYQLADLFMKSLPEA